MTINYIFNEDNLLNELKEYVDRTYSEHYASSGRIQVTEFIASHCNSPDFFLGNVIKYAARYGHKEGYNRKDILKALHYLLMMLDWHDKKSDLRVETPVISIIPFTENGIKTFTASNTNIQVEYDEWIRNKVSKHYGEEK